MHVSRFRSAAILGIKAKLMKQAHSCVPDFVRLKFLLSENEKTTSLCWLSTLSIAMRGKPVRKLRPSTRRLSDCLSHTLGPETYANYRTSSNDPSSCAKTRIFRWMKAGCLKSCRRGKRRAAFISLRRWPLKKRKSSKQPCEKMPRAGVRALGSRREARDRARSTLESKIRSLKINKNRFRA